MLYNYRATMFTYILWFHTDRATITKVYARRGRKDYGGSVHKSNEDKMGNITNIQAKGLQHNRMLRWQQEGGVENM